MTLNEDPDPDQASPTPTGGHPTTVEGTSPESEELRPGDHPAPRVDEVVDDRGSDRDPESPIRFPSIDGKGDASPGQDDEQDLCATVSVRSTGRVSGSEPESGWSMHESGRWIVGDPGSQPKIVARPSRSAQIRPDLSLDWSEEGVLVYRAVSIRGISHYEHAKPRQDAYGVVFDASGRWLVGCVADGVSAARHSHRAADLAVDGFMKTIAIELSTSETVADAATWLRIAGGLNWQGATDLVTLQITAAAHEIFKEGYERNGDLESLARLESEGLKDRDAGQIMATTAVAFVVGANQLSDGRVPFAVLAAAGDSSALILSERVWYPVSAVKNAGSEVASSSVHALPRRLSVTPIIGFLEPGQALAIITDGLGDPLGSGTGVVGRFLAHRWTEPPDPLAFANDVAFFRRTFVDDRTAVLVWVTP